MDQYNRMPAIWAEDKDLIIIRAESQNIHEQQSRLRPQHRNVEQTMQENTYQHRNRKRIAGMALVLPMQANDLANIDKEICKQYHRAHNPEIHKQFQNQIMRMICGK